MKDWPEYLFWYEEGVLHHMVLHSLKEYESPIAQAAMRKEHIAYRAGYQWSSPWIGINPNNKIGTHARPIFKEEVPKEIRMLHLILGG